MPRNSDFECKLFHINPKNIYYLVIIYTSGFAASLQRLRRCRGLGLQENLQSKTIPGPRGSFSQNFSSIGLAILQIDDILFQPFRRVIVTPAVTRDYFSLKPSPDQQEASHKISTQQVQPFHKQTTLYFYSIALYIYYCKNRFIPDFRRTHGWIRKIFSLPGTKEKIPTKLQLNRLSRFGGKSKHTYRQTQILVFCINRWLKIEYKCYNSE